MELPVSSIPLVCLLNLGLLVSYVGNIYAAVIAQVVLHLEFN